MYNQFNKTLYLSALIFLLSASVFVACNTKADKTDEESKETTVVAKPSDWQPFKESVSTSIANNEERIKTLKTKIQKPGMPNLDKLRQKRINDLEDQNTALRAKLLEYKEDNISDNLEQFKAEVKQQLDEIDQKLKELDK